MDHDVGTAPPTVAEFARRVVEALREVERVDHGFFYVHRFTVEVLGEELQSFGWDGTNFVPAEPDTALLDRIARMMAAPAGSTVGMLVQIADLVRGSGRPITTEAGQTEPIWMRGLLR